MTKNAWLGDVTPSMKSKPTTDSTPETPGTRLDDVLGLRDHVAGAVERGAFGQPHGGEQRALVFLGQEALRRLREQEARRRDDGDHQHDAENGDAHQPVHEPAIAVARLVDAARARSAAGRGSAGRA